LLAIHESSSPAKGGRRSEVHPSRKVSHSGDFCTTHGGRTFVNSDYLVGPKQRSYLIGTRSKSYPAFVRKVSGSLPEQIRHEWTVSIFSYQALLGESS
jgi:hypothetical protein